MAYNPELTQEYLKNLIERVNALEQINFTSHPVDRGTYQGVIYDIVADSGSETVWLQVCPFWPSVASDAGDLKFLDTTDNPLDGTTGGSPESPVPIRYDKVYPTNMPLDFVGLYYHKGDVITYYPYYGTPDGTNTAPTAYQLIQGSYVTTKANLSFPALIKPKLAAVMDSTSDGDCTPYGSPNLRGGQVAYDFTAQDPKFPVAASEGDSSNNATLDKFWADFQQSSQSEKYQGIAYNLRDVTSPVGVVPPQIVWITPYLNPDVNACDTPEWDFYFTADAGIGDFILTDNGTVPGVYKGVDFFPNTVNQNGTLDLTGSTTLTWQMLGTTPFTSDADKVWIINRYELNKDPSLPMTAYWNLTLNTGPWVCKYYGQDNKTPSRAIYLIETLSPYVCG